MKKLTKTEIEAVIRSIKHWKKDIQARLLKREKIDKYDITWYGSGEPVDCWSDSCPLCKFCTSKFSLRRCSMCPYTKKYKVSCYSRHWSKFINSPNLRTCNAMIKALEKILE